MAEVTVHLAQPRNLLPEGVVHLTLTMEEARVVKDLCDLVAGNPKVTTRLHADSVSAALERAGFKTAVLNTPESAFKGVDIAPVSIDFWSPRFYG